MSSEATQALKINKKKHKIMKNVNLNLGSHA